MRVVAIRGRNIASLSGDFSVELDKPPLSSLGLFAIHGPVGAGKSTLLDALTLALYGRTPRLSGVGGAPIGDPDGDDEIRSNDPRTLVRRGSALAYAEADFTGLDGRLYRARWEVKRGRVKNGKSRLQPEKQSLIDVALGARLGDTNTQVRREVEERIGLSFDELCRSVLLAQGGFQGFLQAKPAERGELLEKVTGTAIYTRLSIAAHERARRLRDEENALAVARAALHVFDDVERAAKESEAVRSSMAATAAEDLAAQKNLELDQARARKVRLRATAEAKLALSKAKATSQAAEERFQRADEAWTAVASQQEALRGALDRARLLDARIAASSSSPAPAEHARAASVVNAARAALFMVQQQQQACAAKKASAEASLAQATPLSPAIAAAAISGLQRLERARSDVDGARAVLDAVGRRAAEAAAVVDERRTLWLQKRVERPASLVGRSLERVLVGLYRRRVVVEEARQGALQMELTIARQVRERLVRALSKADERARLEEGEPCPLCGSLEHPWAHGAPAGVVADEDRRVTELEAELSLCTVRLLTARAGARLGEDDVSDDEDCGVEFDVEFVVGCVAREAEASVAEAAVRDAEAEADAAARDVAFHHESLGAKEAAIKDLTTQLRALGLADSDLVAPKKRAKSLARDIEEKEAAVAAHARAVADEAAVEPEVRAAEARVALGVEGLAAATVALDAWSQGHAALLAERRAVLDDDVAAVELRMRAARQDAEANLEAARRSRAASASALSSARAVVAEREAAVDGEGDSDVEGAIDAAEAAAAAARADAVKFREAHALLRAALTHDAGLVGRAHALDKELAAHREKARVWWELAAVIGSSDGARFRQFAQSLTLDALVVHANEQLKTLAPRYRLQRVSHTNARHDLDLVIVDREAADEVRSTSTLSGGESFLVSLALALGLSSLSANEGARGRVESLFIDEGFSALDPETLDTALSAFDALRQTGRQIGVISHVPLLVERLGAQVRIIPIGGGASRVEVRAG